MCSSQCTSLKILKILSSIQTRAVFPADQIPRLWTKPTTFIVNTDDHTKPGMLWVAFYVNKFSNGLYFDSLGLPPVIPDHINRLRKNCKTFRWNAIQLQNDGSDVCGQYCIMFSYYMSHSLGFKKFLDNFSENLEKNDNVVKRYVFYKNADGNFTGSGGCFVRCLQNSRCKMSLL